jgi:hypothetical protein
MPNTDIVDLAEAMSKTGAELFKELYRVYPVAEHEDYFRMGQWNNDLMKKDLALIESHRRESGAPDVPDIDEIKMPTLPMGGSAKPTLVGGVQQAPVAANGVKPVGTQVPAAYTAGGSAAITAAGAPVVEIRLIALFVAKWKLDPQASKAALAKLTSAHRRYIIQNFKTQATGAAASKELETYVATCEADKSWDAVATNGAANGKAAADTPATAGTAATPVATGLKRPLTPANPSTANKLLKPTIIAKTGGNVTN